MQFTAAVITGSGRGKSLKCPTLNLDLSCIPADLETGVYACFARMGAGGLRLPAAMHFGARPTFGDTNSCEVHVIDHAVAIPPQSVSVDVVSKLRDVQTFDSAEALTMQMQRDIAGARSILCIPC